MDSLLKKVTYMIVEPTCGTTNETLVRHHVESVSSANLRGGYDG